MVAIYPDGDYRHGATYANANDREMYERTFAIGTDEQQRIAQAMITASPETSNDEIRAKMASLPPAAPSGLVKVSPTIDDVIQVSPAAPHLNDRAPTDFSGTNAGRDGSSRASLSAF